MLPGSGKAMTRATALGGNAHPTDLHRGDYREQSSLLRQHPTVVRQSAIGTIPSPSLATASQNVVTLNHLLD